MSPASRAAMAIRHVLFDLDNTLYPARAGLMAELDRRIAQYLARELRLSLRQAQRLQADYCWRYGTCAGGLRRHTRLDLRRFVASVHDIDVGRYLTPNPTLAEVLDRLPQRKWVFTNAAEEYARRVLEALGVADRFAGVFGIHFMGFAGKPEPAVYGRVLAALGVAGDSCAMVDDAARNLRPAKAMGMGTVWLTASPHPAPPWVDARTADLTALPRVLSVLRARGHRVRAS